MSTKHQNNYFRTSTLLIQQSPRHKLSELSMKKNEKKTIKAQELVRNSSTSEQLESARGGEWALSNIDIKEEKKCDKMALTA